jgi:hypothetical protein
MIVNETKTKMMVYGKDSNHMFLYNGNILETVNIYKYLGIVYKATTKCSGNIFIDGYKYTSNQARKAMFKLLKDTRQLGMLPPNVAFHLFDSLVMPILEYGSEVWYCNKDIIDLERIHTRFIKIILGVHNNVSNHAVYGETGRYPLLIRQKVKVFKYWFKIIQMSESSLVKMIYNSLVSLNNCGFKTWASNVESMLTSAGLSHLWTNQCCTKQDINLFKSTICENYVELWRKDITNVTLHPKLRTFCTFKTTFVMETYLLNVQDFKLRRVTWFVHITSSTF